VNARAISSSSRVRLIIADGIIPSAYRSRVVLMRRASL